jgi:hypothetical protein
MSVRAALFSGEKMPKPHKIRPTMVKNEPEGTRKSNITAGLIGGLSGFLNLAVANAGCADANALVSAMDNGSDRLQVQIPAALGDIVGVADLIAELGTPATHIANSCHYENLLNYLS